MSVRNWKIGTRLLFGFGLVLLLMLIVASVGAYQIWSVEQTLREAKDLERRAALAERWAMKTQINLSRVMTVAKSGNNPEVKAYTQPLITQTTQEINALQKTLEAEIDDPQVRAQMERVAGLRQAYIDARKAYFDLVEAYEIEAAATALEQKLVPAATAYSDAQMRMVELQRAQTDRFIDEQIQPQISQQSS